MWLTTVTNQQFSSVQGPTCVIRKKEEIAFLGQWSAGTAFKNLSATCKIQIQKGLIGHIETPLVVNALDMMSSGQQNVLNLLWTCHFEWQLWVLCVCYVLRIEPWVASGSRNILQKLTNYVNPYLICSKLFQMMTMHMTGYALHLLIIYCYFIICWIWYLRSSSVGQYFEVSRSCPKAVSIS